MKDFLYGEGGAMILLGIDEFISHYFNNPDIIPHAYKWAVPFLVIGLVYVKRFIMVRMAKKPV